MFTIRVQIPQKAILSNTGNTTYPSTNTAAVSLNLEAFLHGHRVFNLVLFMINGLALIAVGLHCVGDVVSIFLLFIGWYKARNRNLSNTQNNMLVQVDRRSYHPLKALHPCPKSVEEMIFLIESLTKPGQVILDCFCGLGSTLVAAEQLGRFWIGCDKSLTYCRWAMKRLAKAQ